MSEARSETTTSRPERRAQRRNELLTSTVALIRREGPLVSMDRIAAECGVTKPIIYRYFGDREGLVREVACRLVAEFSIEMHRAIGDALASGPRDHLEATIKSFLTVVERETNLYRFINHHTSVERRDLFGRLVAEGFAKALEHSLRNSSVPANAPRTWGYALIGILHYTSDWWTEEQTLSRDELVDHLMALMWDGLANVGSNRRDGPSAPAPPTPA